MIVKKILNSYTISGILTPFPSDYLLGINIQKPLNYTQYFDIITGHI